MTFKSALLIQGGKEIFKRPFSKNQSGSGFINTVHYNCLTER